MNKQLKTAGITILAAAIAGGIAALVIRDQIQRHQRNLFHPRSIRRLAALGHMHREPASVDSVRLLRDFIAWEPKHLLRERAKGILRRMEGEVTAPPPQASGGAA